ncbi:MAG: hypothetical protein ACPGVU_17340 [Limisphaerales bacterium]
MFGIFKGISFFTKWIYRLIVIGLLLLIGAFLLRDPLLQSLAEKRITENTGLDARMEKLDVALLDQRATLLDLRIYNSAEFGGGVMLDIAELHFELDAQALRDQTLHFKLIRLEVRNLNMVINADGKTNFDAVREYRNARRAQQPADSPLDDIIDPSLSFRGIDSLNLSVGNFTTTKLPSSGPPDTVAINANNAVYSHIHSKEQLLESLEPEIIRTAAEYLHAAYFGE